MKPLNIIFLGPPGSGKGTQVQKLICKFNLENIATGDIARELAARNTRLGQKVKKIIEKGEAVPVEIIVKAVDDKLAKIDRNKGLMFDHFPWNIKEAQEFEKLIKKYKLAPPKVIYLKTDKENLITRLTTRKICDSCGRIFSPSSSIYKKGICSCGGKLSTREDVSPCMAKKRINVYFKETKPLVDYYRRKGVLVEVDGNQSIEKVYEDTLRKIGE
jgi:adenylate kinase